jgi:hypothetical protein
MNRSVPSIALAALLAAGCGSSSTDEAAGDATDDVPTEKPVQALDRAAGAQQAIDEAEKKRREAIEEQGD